jgi:hypothetical protein
LRIYQLLPTLGKGGNQKGSLKPLRFLKRGYAPLALRREPDHRAQAMQPHMVRVFPFLNSNPQVRHLRINVPLIACLFDGERYVLPGNLPAPAGHDLRALNRPRLTAHRTGTPCASSSAAMREAALPTPACELEGFFAALAGDLSDRPFSGDVGI